MLLLLIVSLATTLIVGLVIARKIRARTALCTATQLLAAVPASTAAASALRGPPWVTLLVVSVASTAAMVIVYVIYWRRIPAVAAPFAAIASFLCASWGVLMAITDVPFLFGTSPSVAIGAPTVALPPWAVAGVIASWGCVGGLSAFGLVAGMVEASNRQRDTSRPPGWHQSKGESSSQDMRGGRAG